MNSEIELRHFRYFVAVAEELHFGNAAKRLHMAQPPLSQAIRKLEARLGHPLFVRHTREVALTAAGRTLLERVRRTLAKVDDDLEAARRIGLGEVGTLTVGFAGSVMLTALPIALREYRRRYPAVNLRLREMVTAAQLESLTEGSLDVGLLRDPGDQPSLAVEILWREPFLAIVPRKHRLATKKQIFVRDLKHEPFVLFAREWGPEAYDRTIGVCQSAGFTPRVIQEASQWYTVTRLIEAGFGVSIAPSCVASFSFAGVRYLPLRRVTAQTEVALGIATGELKPTVAAFRHMLREVYGVERPAEHSGSSIQHSASLWEGALEGSRPRDPAKSPKRPFPDVS
jgi:DNA-binding transcriptional LysR family regulator